ncbi:uncharacterized protein LOC122577212 [Bombus pyrosoma]|uniref:uncharacterized protein LOC122577212 n=1 Tax=Bombus pyrosoma TaxID=396416 RepID=UPI001CB95CF1|nr:uncharacterized protein LOC122577212 [Bombus pyrosoma]
MSQGAIFCPFSGNSTGTSLIMEIFRCLSADFVPFYTPNALHALFDVEIIQTDRTLQYFFRFTGILTVTSLIAEIFRRLSASFAPFYTPNVVHALFDVEIIQTARKLQSFFRFSGNLTVIPLIIDIFRRLLAHAIPFYPPNVVRVVSNVEIIQTARKLQPFLRFSGNSTGTSLIMEIFRCLSADFVPFYTANVVHALFDVEIIQTARKLQYFFRFTGNLTVISLIIEIFRRLSAPFVPFYTPNALHALFDVEIIQTDRKLQYFFRFSGNLTVTSLIIKIFGRSSASVVPFYTPNAVRVVSNVETIPASRKVQSFVHFQEILQVLR